MSIEPEQRPESERRGFLAALGAYLIWGVLPLFMKAVAHIPVTEILAHRIVWSVPVAAMVLMALGQLKDVVPALTSSKTLAFAALTAALISFNWGLYVWAIVNGRTLDAALGYYINPFIAVLLGSVFLGERLSRTQWTAIALAALGIALITWDAGGLPLVSLALAVSFGFYGFFKRKLPIGPAPGLLLEVLILLPPAIAYIVYVEAGGRGMMFASWRDFLLLVASGVLTAVPLILYAAGAKGLKLATLGIMQYIAPSMVFLIAVFVFGEPFTMMRLVAFGFIWSALLIYMWPLLAELRQRTAARLG